MSKAFVPLFWLVAALTAAGYAVAGRFYAGWSEVSERLLPFAVLAGLLYGAAELWPRWRGGVAPTTGIAAAALFVPPFAVNFWGPGTTVLALTAVTAVVCVAAKPARRLPWIVPLVLSAAIAWALFDAGNLVLAVFIGVAWPARALFCRFAVVVVSVGYLYGGVAEGTGLVLGGSLLLINMIPWGRTCAEEANSGGSAGRRYFSMPTSSAVGRAWR